MNTVCNREWDAEGVGLLACDLPAGHSGSHLCGLDGTVYSAPNLDGLEDGP